MNLGLGNLYIVKRNLQSPTMALETSYDTTIALLAKGVALAFEKHCNRKFARVEGDTFTMEADRLQAWLPRAPVETLTSIEQKDDSVVGWYALDVDDAVLNHSLETGWLMFNGLPGQAGSIIRITYTGGYYFNTNEVEDLGTPAGYTDIPADLQMAWLYQIEHIWSQRDKLGVGMADDPGKASQLKQVELLPMVKEILQTYKRFAP